MGIVTRLNPLGGTLKFYYFTVNATPTDCKVQINDSITRYIIAKSGTKIYWRVSCTGHTAQEGVLTLLENTVLNVELAETQYQKFKINPTPSDSTVFINGEIKNEIIVEFGTIIQWEVKRNGYIAQSNSLELIDDIVLDVELEKEKYNFQIVTIPPNTDVYINNTKQTSAIIPFEESASWTVKKYGYATQTGNTLIIEDTILEITLVEVPFYSVSIIPIPENSIVVINSDETNQTYLEQNSIVEWSVSSSGYIEQKGTFLLTEDTVLNIVLEKKKFIFQIVSTPTDCVITINDSEFSSLIVEYNTTVNWSVMRNGYIEQTGEHTVIEDTTLYIDLEKENYTYNIIPEPADSIIYINGVEQTSITVPYETNVSYSVSRVGYVAQTGIFQVLENYSHKITLEKMNYSFSIIPNIETATIYVNGELAIFPIVAEYGTVMNWSVSTTGYVSQSGSTTLTSNIELNITLVKQIFRVTIQPTPSDSKILINGIETNYIDAPFMTEFQYEVSHVGYLTKSGSYTIINDWTLPVVLDILQYTLTINPTPANSSIIINGVAQNSITVNYGTTVSWSVSATGYTTKSGTHTVVEDFTLDVLLSLGYFTVTFSPTPTDATVMINNVVQKSFTAIYGTLFNWSVSAPYYISQTGSEQITKTYTKSVTLQENISSVSLSGATFSSSPSSSRTVSGSTISWTISTSKISASTLTAYVTNSSGLVSGPCKVKMSYNYSTGPRISNWSFKLYYTVKTDGKSSSTTVNGTSCTIILAENQILTRFDMRYSGTSTSISANQRAVCSLSLYKYV